jgi:hypothetical protein
VEVTATINGFANASNEEAAFAVHMTAGPQHSRLVPLKPPMTINQAELAAAEYVCQAIHPEVVPVTDLVIKTCNPYLVGVGERTGDKWKVNPKTNLELVNKVRASLGRFKSFSIVIDSDSPLMLDLKAKARTNRVEA